MTPAQLERIALLAEEAAEVVEICMKIVRHGLYSYNPDDLAQTPNAILLARELGDMQYAIRLLCQAGDLDPKEIQTGDAIARTRKPKYLHHQAG